MKTINWTQTFINTVSQNGTAIAILVIIWCVIWAATIWDCLARLKDPNRLTWLVVIIAVPVLGVVYYWLKGYDEGIHTKAKRLEDI